MNAMPITKIISNRTTEVVRCACSAPYTLPNGARVEAWSSPGGARKGVIINGITFTPDDIAELAARELPTWRGMAMLGDARRQEDEP